MKENKNTGHSFVDYFKRATSTLVVLRLLTEKPAYAYELSQTMKERSGGKYTMPLLYPLLYRLEEQGFVCQSGQEVSGDNRVRIYYAITEAGKTHLAELEASYREMSEVLEQIVNPEERAVKRA